MSIRCDSFKAVTVQFVDFLEKKQSRGWGKEDKETLTTDTTSFELPNVLFVV